MSRASPPNARTISAIPVKCNLNYLRVFNTIGKNFCFNRLFSPNDINQLKLDFTGSHKTTSQDYNQYFQVIMAKKKMKLVPREQYLQALPKRNTSKPDKTSFTSRVEATIDQHPSFTSSQTRKCSRR